MIALADATINTMLIRVLNHWRGMAAVALTDGDADVTGLVDMLS